MSLSRSNALRLTIALPFFLLALLLGLWWATLHAIDQDRKLALDGYRTDSQNLVRALDEHVDSLTREVDQTVRFLKYRFERSPGTLDIMNLLGEEVIIDRYYTQLGIVDADGVLIMTNKTPFKRVNVGDREHFKVHQQDPNRGLFISKPILGRSSGKWSLQFTRRIDKADGSFGGIVVVSVDPFYFTDLYRDVDTSIGGGIMLVGLDGVVRASRNTDVAKLGDKVDQLAWFQRVKSEPVFQMQTQDAHGLDILVTARHLRNQPVAVVLQERLADVLSEHFQRKQGMLQAATIATILLLISGGFIYWLAFRLQRSQSAAESANRMKSEFLAQMSHELRTPLNGILGAAELIADGNDLAEDKQLAGLIQRSGQQLREQVDAILDLARLEAGRLTLRKEMQSLGTLLVEVCDTHEPFATQKGLPILRRWDDAELGQAMVDGVRLREVLGNLLHNAIKYTQTGEVCVNAEREGEQLLVTVSDTGIGIDEEDQAIVFEKFRQVERFATRHHGGSGLGLALVRELVQLMQGKIHLISAPDRGSHFTIMLPLEDKGA
ncbi:ATP-binding protein [Chitinimonas naiadis]